MWRFAPHLPARDRIRSNENRTQPIHPAVMSPLLGWVLRFVQDFADDTIAAWSEYRRLTARIQQAAYPGAAAALTAFIDRYHAEGRLLPGAVTNGKVGVARAYLATVHRTSICQVGTCFPILESPARWALYGWEQRGIRRRLRTCAGGAAMAENSFDSGEALVAALADRKLSSDHQYTGMVKASDKDKHVAFAPGSCDSGWIDLPAEVIGKVEIIDQVPCREHSHPLVRMQLKLDESNPLHVMAGQLIASAGSRLSAIQPSHPATASTSAAGGQDDLSSAAGQLRSIAPMDLKEFYWDVPSDVHGCSLAGAHLTLRRDGSASWRGVVNSIYSNDAYCVTLSFLNSGGRELFAWPRFCSQTLWQNPQVWTNNNLAFPEQFFDTIAIVSRRDHC